ncbi:MAG: hypothetical protein HOQ34_18390 [Gemmatimonadaceae bacterium]|nr:hypothetical protein [Gemmatimonadaceae bacterium]
MIRILAFVARLLRRTHDTAPPTAAAPMAMLDCESVMRELWDYLDGELTPERMAAIRAHIDMCKRCYPQHQFERAFLDALAARAPQHSHPDQVAAKVLAALEARGLTP